MDNPEMDSLERLVYNAIGTIATRETFLHTQFQEELDLDSALKSLEHKGFIKRVNSPHSLGKSIYWEASNEWTAAEVLKYG